MLDKSKVLSLIKEKGPLLPREVAKQFGSDTFITGAILSTMVDAKEIKMSYSKIGGSPVYYLVGQEEKLSILYLYLPGKEKEALTLLKDMKLIKDSTAEPAIRVALRNIKDFAKPIEVNIGETKEIFWKWHLFPNQDAEKAIREFFLPRQEKTTAIIAQEPAKIEQKTQTVEIKKPEEEIKTPISVIKLPKQEILAEKQHTLGFELQKPKEIDEKKEEKTTKQEPDTNLLLRIKKLFNELKIEIMETQIIRKSTELEMVINIPSPVGKLRYFCKIRDKKKTSDKDLSSLYIQAQMKKMPVLYVTTGEITKKAKEMAETEFKIISIMKI